MSKLYKDYFWKEGIPYGMGTLESHENVSSEAYKIVMDPYRKRISIEKYIGEKFNGVIYDSALFNFRHLKPAEQMAWQKFTILETPEKIESLIRNQDDRVVVREVYSFEKGFCRECQAFSPQGYPISIQRMYYTALNDPFNGVVLFDTLQHPVLYKKYSVNEETGEFAELLEEQWDMSKFSLQLRETADNTNERR